jgi:DNA-binding Lrp family transcriptional regulator
MVTAIVLTSVRRDAINETAEALADLEGIAEVYSVAGEWDLVAPIRAKNNEQLAQIVTEHMLKMGGIQKTTTLIAFRAYSRYDLEHMISIGMEGD